MRPLRIAVISDSHLEGPNARVQAIYDRHLAPADLLLHCGDMVGAPLYHFLARHPRFSCVRGNCDHFVLGHDLPNVLSLALPLPSGRELKIGMAHGWGERGSVWQRVAELFPGHDLICYGHTHRPDFTRHGDIEGGGSWLLNPGSLAEGSLALVDVDGAGGMTCAFVDLGNED